MYEVSRGAVPDRAALPRRAWLGRSVSTIGLGPCREPGEESADSVLFALQSGLNVLDTGPQFHGGAHERAVGEAMARFCAQRGERSAVVVATQVGPVPDLLENTVSDIGFGRLWALVEERYVRTGLFGWGELAGSHHTLSPAWLRHSLRSSLQRLGLTHVDCVFLAAPTLHQTAVSPRLYEARVRRAFEALEALCEEGLALSWGIAEEGPFDLGALLRLTEPGMRLSAVRVPYSPLQQETRPVVDVACEAGLTVFASGCLDGGSPRYVFPPEIASFFGEQDDASAALRWVQSTPGVGVALVGSRARRHLQALLAAACLPPLDSSFHRAGGAL